MDKWTFAMELIKALIWPLFLLVVILIFYRPLADLIARLKKASVGNVGLEFSKVLEEAKTASVEAEKEKLKSSVLRKEASQDRLIRTEDSGHGDDHVVRLDRSDLEQDFLPLVELADKSPREVILVSWMRLESEVRSVAERYRLGVLEKTKLRSSLIIAKELARAEVLSENDLHLFDRLRYLRNKVVHVEDFKPQSDEALEYAGLALQLAKYLRGK